MSFGIEKINVYAGCACVDVADLATHRGLDEKRFSNLMMRQKSVALPFEDPVSFAVNAARPILDDLSPAERAAIRIVITCSESGIDFGKSLSTYVHHHLGLSRNCRMFEVKQACYSGTAGLQTALAMLQAPHIKGSKALVIATDISRFLLKYGQHPQETEWGYAEISSGAGAVAMLLGDEPEVIHFDIGATGHYGYEVMDTCRPAPDMEAGNPDLSLLSYLDCCEQAFRHYAEQVESVSYAETFGSLAFHSPFGGMVKGAHRMMMKKFSRAGAAEIESDFNRRVMPGLLYGQSIGNILGGSALLSLISTIENTASKAPFRIGIFSYGSGCCSEFYSGIVTSGAHEVVARHAVRDHLESRCVLSMLEYDRLLSANGRMAFGTRDIKVDLEMKHLLAQASPGSQRLMLTGINGYHREYEWLK